MSKQDFGSLFTNTVLDCLSELLGPTAAQAFNFYIDPKLASENPSAYVSKLQSFIGQAASEIILRNIANSLSDQLGLERTPHPVGFHDFIQESKTAFKEQNLSRSGHARNDS